MEKSRELHIAMFPWFAFGHIIPYLHLSNELAERGHKVTFFLPKKAQSKLQRLNSHPHLITFHPLIVPHADGLPPGTETVSDIDRSLTHLLVIALDRTRDQVEAALRTLNPHILFYDFAYWAPVLASQLGIKSVFYGAVSAAGLSYTPLPNDQVEECGGDCRRKLRDGSVSPPGYPSSTVVLRQHELRLTDFINKPFGEGITFQQRITTAVARADAISIRTCQEMEGSFCDYIGIRYGKPVFLTGPVLPKPSPEPLEDRWARWLGGFGPSSVIFCALGSENIMVQDQFQELLLGLELTGLPFLAVLKPPPGATTVEEAFPEGFQERVRGRGVVHGGWVPQPAILRHPSVGCFLSHAGHGSMWESLTTHPQIVLLPEYADHIFTARLLAEELKVAVEVEKEEYGLFSKERLCAAIKTVMDEESARGALVKKNHAKWKETLVSPRFMSNYIDNFVAQLLGLLDQK